MVTRPPSSTAPPNVPGNVPVRFGQAPAGDLKIGRAHDMVPIEDAPRLVARDAHGHSLGHPGIDQVSDSGPPEVMAQHSGAAGLFARLRPGFPEVAPPR